MPRTSKTPFSHSKFNYNKYVNIGSAIYGRRSAGQRFVPTRDDSMCILLDFNFLRSYMCIKKWYVFSEKIALMNGNAPSCFGLTDQN